MIFDDHDYRVMLHTSFAGIMIFIMATHPCNVPPIREDHDKPLDLGLNKSIPAVLSVKGSSDLTPAGLRVSRLGVRVVDRFLHLSNLSTFGSVNLDEHQ